MRLQLIHSLGVTMPTKLNVGGPLKQQVDQNSTSPISNKQAQPIMLIGIE